MVLLNQHPPMVAPSPEVVTYLTKLEAGRVCWIGCEAWDYWDKHYGDWTCYHNATSFIGKDLRTITNVSSGWQCQQECRQASECKFFTWHDERPVKPTGVCEEGVGGSCRLLSSLTEMRANMSKFQSGPKSCVEDRNESQHLHRLYETMGGPDFANSSGAKHAGYNTTTCYCTWDSVRCNDDTWESRLTEVHNMNSVDLHGSIPQTLLGEFKHVWRVDLSGSHRLKGDLPRALPPLIQTFSCQQCGNLRGTLPSEWGSLSMLHTLTFSSNLIEGTLPAAWANLNPGDVWSESAWKAQGVILEFNNNSISGTLPAEWGRTLKLRVIEFQQNHLHGTIPSSWCNLANLSFLALGQNSFEGTIPLQLGRLSNLGQVSLYSNLLVGTVPNISSMKLSSLLLHDNMLEGTLPPLPRCLLGGSAAQWDVPCGNTQRLLVSHNFLSCALPDLHAAPPTETFASLVLQGNEFKMPIPAWMEAPSTNLFSDDPKYWIECLIAAFTGAVLIVAVRRKRRNRSWTEATSAGAFGDAGREFFGEKFRAETIGRRGLWLLWFVAVLASIVYFTGANRYQCMVASYRFTGAYLYAAPLSEWSIAILISMTTLFAWSRLLSAAAAAKGVRIPFGGPSQEALSAKTVLGFFFLVLLLCALGITTAIYALTFSIPEQNFLHLDSQLVSNIRMFVPAFVGVMNGTVIPFICRWMGRRTGIMEEYLLFPCLMVNMWVAPLITAVGFNESCLGGWRLLWYQCQTDASGAFVYDTYSIQFGGVPVMTQADACLISYNAAGRCPRAVIEVMGPLLVGHLVSNKLLLPGAILCGWLLTQPAEATRSMMVRRVHGLSRTFMDTRFQRVTWTLWIQTLLIFGPLIPYLVPVVFTGLATSAVVLETTDQSLPRALNISCIASGIVLGWGLQLWLFFENDLHGGMLLAILPALVLVLTMVKRCMPSYEPDSVDCNGTILSCGPEIGTSMSTEFVSPSFHSKASSRPGEQELPKSPRTVTPPVSLGC